MNPDPLACATCGGVDLELIAARDRRLTRYDDGRAAAWTERVERFRCRVCGRTVYQTRRIDAVAIPPPADAPTAIRPDPNPGDGVDYPVPIIRCPACGSSDTLVRSTTRPVRYHRCRGCGGTFKSVERPV